MYADALDAGRPGGDLDDAKQIARVDRAAELGGEYQTRVGPLIPGAQPDRPVERTSIFDDWRAEVGRMAQSVRARGSAQFREVVNGFVNETWRNCRDGVDVARWHGRAIKRDLQVCDAGGDTRLRPVSS